MKVSKERLLKITETFLSKRLKTDRGIVCVYLIGSMLTEDPFINGTTDVDLVVVHNQPVMDRREILSITEAVTLDLHHIEQSYYSPPRKIRKDPWIGSSLCFDPILLYGKGHWFEFAQASVEAGFFSPEYVIYRSRLFSNEARTLLTDLGNIIHHGSSAYTAAYLKILENSCNAIASLYKMPLTDRTMMKQFKTSADALEHPELTADLFELILGQNDPSPFFDYFFNSWQYYLEYLGSSEYASEKMRTNRIQYYTAPVSYYWNEHLTSALWIMAKTWSSVAQSLQLDGNEYYESLCSILEIGPQFYSQRRQQMEAFVDKVEELQTEWEISQGLDEEKTILL